MRDPGPDDVVLCVGGVHLMSARWAPKLGFPGVPSIQGCTLRKLPDRVMGDVDDGEGCGGAASLNREFVREAKTIPQRARK